MNTYRRIFIDTGAFLALADPRDSLHGVAARFYRSLSPTTPKLTTWGVVSETYTWLCYHVNGSRARTWLGLIRDAEVDGSLDLIFPDLELDTRTRRLLDRYDDQQLSYVDGLTLAVIQTHPSIEAVFAFDHHLTLAGLPVLPGS